MEEKYEFIGMKEINSKKKGKFFIIYYVQGEEAGNIFCDESVFREIQNKKFKKYDKVTAEFKIVKKGNILARNLVDMK